MKPEDLLAPPPNLPEPLREYAALAATEPGRRVLSWVVGGLLALAFLAFLAAGANKPADPQLGAPSTTTTTLVPKPSRIPGYDEVRFAVVPATALTTTGSPPATTPFCAAAADTPDQQAKGLMNRTDLAGYDGMLFRFPADTDTAFHMKNTKIPLTLSWFDGLGRYLGSVDMTPCPAKARTCPEYRAPGGVKFRYALETQQGGTARLGITAGSAIVAAGGCG